MSNFYISLPFLLHLQTCEFFFLLKYYAYTILYFYFNLLWRHSTVIFEHASQRPFQPRCRFRPCYWAVEILRYLFATIDDFFIEAAATINCSGDFLLVYTHLEAYISNPINPFILIPSCRKCLVTQKVSRLKTPPIFKFFQVILDLLFSS